MTISYLFDAELNIYYCPLSENTVYVMKTIPMNMQHVAKTVTEIHN